jgi:hypothetical protein
LQYIKYGQTAARDPHVALKRFFAVKLKIVDILKPALLNEIKVIIKNWLRLEDK